MRHELEIIQEEINEACDNTLKTADKILASANDIMAELDRLHALAKETGRA